jgi:hypothetical protein
MVRMLRIQKVTGSPSAIQSYLSVASKNPFYHAGNVKYYYFHLANLNQHKKKDALEKYLKFYKIGSHVGDKCSNFKIDFAQFSYSIRNKFFFIHLNCRLY